MQSLRVQAGAQRIAGRDQVQLDVRTFRDGEVLQMPQITVPVGKSASIRTGTAADDGAFTGWVADCTVEQDRVLVDWSLIDDGVRIESGLSMTPIR